RARYSREARERCLETRSRGETADFKQELAAIHGSYASAIGPAIHQGSEVAAQPSGAVLSYQRIRSEQYSKGATQKPWHQQPKRSREQSAAARNYAIREGISFDEALSIFDKMSA